jgi:SAM-dependent methyltransferase
MDLIKLNVGASPIWEKDGWHTLDHKLVENRGTSIAGDAASISLPDNRCATVFCSHMIEHIPHTKLESILLEFNRVLSPGGVLRILVPDLKKIARAYVNEDAEFFRRAQEEDESIRTDLGFGGMLVNFIVSPGQDTALMNRGLDKFIAGYAHIYAYDWVRWYSTT